MNRLDKKFSDISMACNQNISTKYLVLKHTMIIYYPIEMLDMRFSPTFDSKH